MLKEAVELQQNAVRKLVELSSNKDKLTFKAPTGSGKTYMMADFMDRMLDEDKDIIFLVSTLSKGNLAQQNFEKFKEYSVSGNFKNLRPYLISSDISGEESLYVPTEYNVYVLPRDLYKKGGRLMQGAMENFLKTMTMEKWFGGKEKKIYLIKDECHIQTNNLDNLSNSYFEKIYNFSATPKLSRRQIPDVEITDEEAVEAKLIKYVIQSDDENVGVAINKFEEVKEKYRNLLGVNPCLIIQISNKDKAEYELNNIIFPELNKVEHQDLKWMLIVDKDENCDTNDIFKVKNMPVSKWKEYAKENSSTIDIIIFKMVISEGWDIPRACMLFQIRDSQSKQLDEQVIGRVRRNPRLLDFEKLSEEAQKLAMTSWVWGIVPEERRIRNVKLFDDPKDFLNNIQIKTTTINDLSKKEEFNIEEYLENNENHNHYMSIFEMFKKLEKVDNEIKKICYNYSVDFQKWWRFNENLDKIVIESNKYLCDYNISMSLKTDEKGKEVISSFPVESMYVDNGNYVNINDWVWKRCDGSDKFSFDSEAEREWASILKELSINHIKKIKTGKINPNSKFYVKDIFGNDVSERLVEYEKYLWGKNYIQNSDIKFEYYLDGIHSSYPDFVLVDNKNNIHLFEVKSVNFSNSQNANFDSEAYKRKVDELKKCYKQASKLTGYYFYLPVLKGEIWYITRLSNGDEVNLTKEQFISSFDN